MTYALEGDEWGDDDDYWDGVCTHEHDEYCDDHCTHDHCMNCGECECAGYCDDYQTYNLRPEETGGQP